MPNEEVSNWACSCCGKVMSDYREVGFEGPPTDHDNPTCFLPGMAWLVLCHECERRKWQREHEE